MKWFQGNPPGIALAAGNGLLLVICAILVWAWGRPASSGAEGVPADTEFSAGQEREQAELEPLTAYRIVTERPVFDESRRPVVTIEGEGVQVAVDDSGDVSERPQVRPTGIVITPEAKMVTLRPESGGDPILAVEGRPLEGDYVGWIVSDIKPRQVTLASLDGDVMKLGLEVNTRKIAEPPKPPPRTEPGEQADGSAQNAADGDLGEDEPVSRAEQIRQRIAERREELRRQAEEGNAQANGSGSNRASQYQNAMRNLIRKRTENDEEEKEDGGDSNDD